MIDGVDQHRQADHIGKQDEFLTHQPIALLPGLGEEADAFEPFGFGQLHLAGEGVQVADQALHHLAQARIGRIGEGGNGLGGDLRFGVAHCHCSRGSFAKHRRCYPLTPALSRRERGYDSVRSNTVPSGNS
ncbi:hypothetical protein D3C80_1788110 [compost metagenome]